MSGWKMGLGATLINLYRGLKSGGGANPLGRGDSDPSALYELDEIPSPRKSVAVEVHILAYNSLKSLIPLPG